MTITPVNSIVIPDEFVAVCSGWYDGINDLLYAVASTGNLTTGTIRPRGCDSDEQWYFTLWNELSADIAHARRAAEKADCDGRDGREDLDTLCDFEAYADSIVERLEREYGLEDWEG